MNLSLSHNPVLGGHKPSSGRVSGRSAECLSPDARVGLAEVRKLLGSQAGAVFWAINYQERHRRLPTAGQIKQGFADLGLRISKSSADRALRKLRAQN